LAPCHRLTGYNNSTPAHAAPSTRGFQEDQTQTDYDPNKRGSLASTGSMAEVLLTMQSAVSNLMRKT